MSDPEAQYFGGRVEEHSLVPLGEARLGRIGFDEWLRRSRSSLIPDRQPNDRGFMKRMLCSLLVATLPFGSVLADAPESKNAKVTLVYQHEQPTVPGKSIKGVLVDYGPGGYSPGHTHAKSAFIYATVLEGEIVSQVNDGPVTAYKAGQSFSELPGDGHGVSASASKTKPAKLLASFVANTNETELTIPFGKKARSSMAGKLSAGHRPGSHHRLRQPQNERQDYGADLPRRRPSKQKGDVWASSNLDLTPVGACE